PAHPRRQVPAAGTGGGPAGVRGPRRGPGDLVEQQIQPFRGGGPTPRIRSAHDQASRGGTTPRTPRIRSAHDRVFRGGTTPHTPRIRFAHVFWASASRRSMSASTSACVTLWRSPSSTWSRLYAL